MKSIKSKAGLEELLKRYREAGVDDTIALRLQLLKQFDCSLTHSLVCLIPSVCKEQRHNAIDDDQIFCRCRK